MARTATESALDYAHFAEAVSLVAGGPGLAVQLRWVNGTEASLTLNGRDTTWSAFEFEFEAGCVRLASFTRDGVPAKDFVLSPNDEIQIAGPVQYRIVGGLLVDDAFSLVYEVQHSLDSLLNPLADSAVLETRQGDRLPASDWSNTFDIPPGRSTLALVQFMSPASLSDIVGLSGTFVGVDPYEEIPVLLRPLSSAR